MVMANGRPQDGINFRISADGTALEGYLVATGATWLTVKLPGLSALVPATAIYMSPPTSDPHVSGQVWANAGVLTRSAG